MRFRYEIVFRVVDAVFRRSSSMRLSYKESLPLCESRFEVHPVMKALEDELLTRFAMKQTARMPKRTRDAFEQFMRSAEVSTFIQRLVAVGITAPALQRFACLTILAGEHKDEGEEERTQNGVLVSDALGDALDIKRKIRNHFCNSLAVFFCVLR